MKKDRSRFWCQTVVLTVLALSLQAEDRPPSPKSASKSIVTSATYDNVELAFGSEQREKVVQAQELIKDRSYEAAGRLLDDVLSFFQKAMTDTNAVYASFASKQEYEIWRKLRAEQKVVWLDWAFRDALHNKAFIASSKKQWPDALKLLNEEIRYAPFAAIAHCEKGYIFNSDGKPSDSLEEYEKALELAEKYASARGDKAMALRGMGYSYIELGDLERAKAAYQKSLEIDPNNKLARSELEFIKERELKK